MKTNRKIIFIPDFLVVLKAFEDGKEKEINDLIEITKIVYCTLYKIKKIFIEKNWITVREERHRHYMRLTEQGKDFLKNVNNMFVKLNINKENIYDFRVVKKMNKKKVKEEE